jgi:hypothetical protein
MRQMDVPETSLLNQLTPRNNTEDGRIQFNHGRSLRSYFVHCHMLGEETTERRNRKQSPQVLQTGVSTVD